MANILDEVLKYMPSDAQISEAGFEGANIVLYTKNKDFVFNANGILKTIVDNIRKRVELRPDPSLTMDTENAKSIIEGVLPEEAKVANIIFDQQRSRVIIEAEKPGLAIGKQGELLKEIKKKTLWIPIVQRTPGIRSKIIENIRYVLYENNDFRKKFLNKVGKRVYGGWTKEKRHEWVRLTMLGGGRQVGRSCVLLQTPESKVLLDCGIDPSKSLTDPEAFPYFDVPEFNLNDLDAVVISHSHLDHGSLVPYLFKMGYEGPVYMTAPTRDITALLCLDFINISQREGTNALYGSVDVKSMVKHTICLNYEEVTDITPDVRLTFYNAGHTLGSCMVHLHIGNGLHNFLYTGDMKFENSNLLAAAATRFPRLETVLIESTYGGRDDKVTSRKDSEDYLVQVVKEVVQRGGKIIMPVLGVGRSQEIMLIVEKLVREGQIPNLPVFVQGMVWDITAIHTTYPDFFNIRVKRNIFHKDQNPFLSDIFKQVGSQKEQKEVIDKKESCIIIATSGMMQGGASVEYFKQLAENKKNALILTCYQAEGTLGRRLQNGEKEINFGAGERRDIVNVNLDIHTISGFSGHASRHELMNFIRRLEPRPKKIITNHGESSKCIDLATTMHKVYKVESIAPKNLETIRLK